MVMKPEPIFEAIEALTQACGHRSQGPTPRCQTLLMSPTGERLSTDLARTLAGVEHLLIICGHYEGIDERVAAALVDRTLSIGDYVLTGGELPAMVVIDALARFIPGVIGHAEATLEESFANGWLEYPQYTRPPLFRNLAVPAVLLSGDHDAIAQWRRQQAEAKTAAARPDLRRQTPNR
jgi:tRNA (guanine37-N1)-methyltransferase